MKTRFTLFLLFLLVNLAFSVNVSAGENPWDVKLPFKEATIHYTITGSETGSETLFIRDYGKDKTRHRKSTSKMMFMSTETDQIEITNPDWVYSIDMKARIGTKATNPVKFMIEEYGRLSAGEKEVVNKNIEEMGASFMQGMQGTVQQNAEKILGYSCDLVSVAGSVTCSIHGTDIALKSSVGMMGMNFTMDANKIDEGPVAGDVFAPPAGIQVTYDKEADNAARAMAKSTIDILKSPDASKKMHQQAADAMNQSESASEQTYPASPMESSSQQEMQKAMDALKGMFDK